jgi:D-3-phosphoglycerate dehydrogenase
LRIQIDMPRVLITVSELVYQEGPSQKILREGGFEVIYPPRGVSLYDPDRLIQHLVGVDAILAGMEPLNRRVLCLSSLRAIARFGVGYDAIDVPAATERGIAVVNTPGANQESAAEHAFALLLGIVRGFPRRDQSVRSGRWDCREPYPSLRGKTLGLVGLGRIGKAVAERAKAFRLRILAFDYQPDEHFAGLHGVRLCSLDEVLRESDFVSLHLPCTDETRRIIDRDALRKMRPASFLINTARGGLVDEGALADALADGHIAGAGLDAFEVEPPATSNRLLQFDNVLLSPHMAGVDEESTRAMSCMAAESLVRLRLEGRALEGCLINPEIGPDWTW